MSDYRHYECPVCEYNLIKHSTDSAKIKCPLCEGDSGHSVTMSTRDAKKEDIVEGYDARKEMLS